MNLKQLKKKYLNHVFDNYGGCTSPDYRTFETAYINGLKQLCKEEGWTFVKALKNHYEFSAVIQRDDGQHVYFSISDVRYWFNGWSENILVRTMKHDSDWSGGSNHYTDIDNVARSIKGLR